MPMFRKKPVVVEARQWIGKGAGVLMLWSKGAVSWNREGEGLCIETLEGKMTVSYGDWIIRGVKGEFYPCKPDIFEETYERAVPEEVAV